MSTYPYYAMRPDRCKSAHGIRMWNSLYTWAPFRNAKARWVW